MVNYKSCSVFGHKEIKINDELVEKLRNIFEKLILQENVRYFYFGGLGEFDELCHKVVTELKVKYPDIARIFCLYDPRHQRANKRPSWLNNENYEEITYLYLDYDYWYTRIYYRNQEIINRSDFVVFYVKSQQNSGAYKAMQYAIQKKKQVINTCIQFD